MKASRLNAPGPSASGDELWIGLAEVEGVAGLYLELEQPGEELFHQLAGALLLDDVLRLMRIFLQVVESLNADGRVEDKLMALEDHGSLFGEVAAVDRVIEALALAPEDRHEAIELNVVGFLDTGEVERLSLIHI